MTSEAAIGDRFFDRQHRGRTVFGLCSVVMFTTCLAMLSSRAVESELQSPKQSSSTVRHVLIISVESLRWDHMSLAGYSRRTSPSIDALAARGIIFRRAYSQAPWTRPSIASTFTSTYPSTHRAADDFRFGQPLAGVDGAPRQLKGSRTASLSTSFETLAEIFSARGYRCFGWSGNPQIWGQLGFAQGFDVYDGVGNRDHTIVRKVDGVFADPDDRPAMVFVHLMRPHFPYQPRKLFRRYGSSESGVRITGENYRQINSGQVHITDSDLAYNVDLYDAAVLETDDRVQQLLEGLDRRGVAAETLVVLLADHGEEFLDHNKVGHGQSVFEELVHVPMVFAGPGIVAGIEIDTPVQNIDLLPTLAGLLWGEDLPDAQGRDLSQVLRSGKVPGQTYVFSESGHPGGFCAVIDGDFKLVYYPGTDVVKLYDLGNDPGELVDLAGRAEYHERTDTLLEAVRQHLAANEAAAAAHVNGPAVLTPAYLFDQLKALGYVFDPGESSPDHSQDAAPAGRDESGGG